MSTGRGKTGRPEDKPKPAVKLVAQGYDQLLWEHPPHTIEAYVRVYDRGSPNYHIWVFVREWAWDGKKQIKVNTVDEGKFKGYANIEVGEVLPLQSRHDDPSKGQDKKKVPYLEWTIPYKLNWAPKVDQDLIRGTFRLHLRMGGGVGAEELFLEWEVYIGKTERDDNGQIIIKEAKAKILELKEQPTVKQPGE